MTRRYYLVNKRTQSHKLITKMYQQRSDATAARWKFIRRLFPKIWKKIHLVSWEGAFGGSEWALKFPADFEIPPDWKKQRNDSSGSYKPRWSTKAGRLLGNEMAEPRYLVPGTAAFGDALGIPGVFTGRGFSTMEVWPTRDGRYVLGLATGQKAPVELKRISDIQKEKICVEETTIEKPRKKKAKAVPQGH